VILTNERPQNYVFNRSASRLQQLMAACNKCSEYLRNILAVVRSAIGSGADSWRLRVRGVIGIILPVHYGLAVNIISKVKTAGMYNCLIYQLHTLAVMRLKLLGTSKLVRAFTFEAMCYKFGGCEFDSLRYHR
jgi:hypothetical protein